MVFEYITSLINLSYKKVTLIDRIKDKLISNKVIKSIHTNKSTYDLLVDFTNVVQIMIRMFGKDEFIKITNSVLHGYYQLEETPIRTRHNIVTTMQCVDSRYDIDIVYHTNNINKDDTNDIEYNISIESLITGTITSYHFSNDTAYKHVDLYKVIYSLVRLCIADIVSSIRKYIYSNQILKK